MAVLEEQGRPVTPQAGSTPDAGSPASGSEVTSPEAELSRLRDEVEALKRARDVFVTAVSHELRTPMTSILGWTSLLASNSLDESTRREGIATIHRSARLQTQLIDDLLDVSRMINGKLQLTIEPIDLPNLVREAFTAIIPVAEAKELQLGMDLQPALPRIVGDARRLQQVFWNLLSNAAKFTPPGGRINARVRSTDEVVIVEVEDTGIGIDPSFAPSIFGRFVQQDGGSKGRHAGMGVGLSIVRHIVELHGGSVSASSEGNDKGATFTVSIPLHRAVQEEAPLTMEREGRRASRSADDIPSILGVRVLVVDPEPDSRRTIAAILESYGASVTSASSGAEGLACAERETFDALLCDVAMPEQDGYSLIRKIRSDTDGKSRIPAVALTSHGGQSERDTALAEGFTAYLRKPFEPADLIALVASAAGRDSREGDDPNGDHEPSERASSPK